MAKNKLLKNIDRNRAVTGRERKSPVILSTGSPTGRDHLAKHSTCALRAALVEFYNREPGKELAAASR
ncbi:MAG: hypothetical protein ABSH09_21790 [Bryobacteraceae bacterium]|jgi:hypothetical protein